MLTLIANDPSPSDGRFYDFEHAYLSGLTDGAERERQNFASLMTEDQVEVLRAMGFAADVPAVQLGVETEDSMIAIVIRRRAIELLELAETVDLERRRRAIHAKEV
ncbi:hypothetical protein [Cellulosimicrobium sp. E-16]|uniref:hypothetical protein n=1 Tax=Cellulosimicrobium sp. E-16 TaxID=3404049 RepID=UPI003CE7603F